jgi:ABC-type branched-subunit amino acid transport system substrate-binding protein
MKSILFLLVVMSVCFTSTYGQNDLASFERAKTLIGYGNFDEAMELLVPYLDERKYGTLSLYAAYHFSYAAYQQGKYELVDETLEPLIESEAWEFNDEAKFLLALSYFQQLRNLEALQELAEIKDPDLVNEGEKASFNFLQKASVSFLVANLSKFESNSGYLLALKEQMEKQTVMSDDEKALYYELQSKKFEENNGNLKNRENDELDIAIILPFNQSGRSGVDRLEPNNFVFELYQGLNFAISELKKSGTKINVRAYDSGRDAAKTKRILADPFVRNVDVIIGPIYPEESELVAYFAEMNKIPYINPLSNVDENFKGMQYAYLYRPSVSSISQGIIDFLKEDLTVKEIAIGYSAATRDELLAKQTADLASKNGFRVVTNKKISEQNIRSFLGEVGITRSESSIADAVIILSDDPNIAAPTYALLESVSVRKPILVMDSWLYFNFANYEMFLTPNIHFIGNNPIDFDKDTVKEFKKDFFGRYSMYPSVNAHLGYDLIHWLSETLNRSSGFDLAKNLNQRGLKQGKVSYGLDFRNSKNNTYVPVLKLENGILEEK